MIKKNQGNFSSSSSLQEDEITLLGNFIEIPEKFPKLDSLLEKFYSPNFFHLTLRKRFKQINQTLYQLILDSPLHSFLLPAILDFFDRINQLKLLNDPLDLPAFEFWLNHFSNASNQENQEVRARIVGKYLPRGEYQAFFPIGMDKTYFGTHFVTAHLSPDVDTMMASFWGWMDAFGARVGSGLHLWCLPGGPPDSPVTSLFGNLLGSGVFPYLARTAPTLTLTAMDLVTQRLLSKEFGHTIVSSIDHHPNEKAIMLVNDQGHYLGDWRNSDVELVRQIIILVKACFHWFENHLHTNLISLFAKADLSIAALASFNFSIFDIRIKDCEPAQDFNERQQNYLDDFFYKVLGVAKGLEGTFRDLNEALAHLSIKGMLRFQEEIEALPSSNIFDQKGNLKENRPLIFHYLKEIIKQLDEAILEVRNYVERLDVGLSIKHKVLGIPQIYLTLRSEVDEIRHKMQTYDFLTVVIHEQDGSLFPVGIVRASDLRERELGTVTLRDFCNLEEVRMASYLEVISVVDHHKSTLKTLSVPTALIGDAQSCNVLIAEQMFVLNDKYSLGGMSLEQIEAQIQEIPVHVTTPSQIRILKRLLQRRLVAHHMQPYCIHSKREFSEYFCFLQAILDDTDLLTKVSHRDLECVAQLLNRLKSLSLKREVEIIHFDDLPRDKNFTKSAAQRILQQADMYSLYKQIYQLRESEVKTHLELCIQGQACNIFLDTKEQNGCARVGQTKIFASNFPFFFQHAQEIRQTWLSQSIEFFKKKPEIDLYLHMISTIASAEEVYRNAVEIHQHRDELWIWTPPTQQGYRHLHSFLAGFQRAIKELKTSLSLEFLDSPPQEFIEIFHDHLPEIPTNYSPQLATPIAILRFKAGALNSRKSMITPYLPHPL